MKLIKACNNNYINNNDEVEEENNNICSFKTFFYKNIKFFYFKSSKQKVFILYLF